MKRIGLTGGMGAGKSMVASIFTALGMPVFNADLVGKTALNDFDVKHQIKAVFGALVFSEDGSVDTKKMASIVFTDKASLERLTSITHPYIYHAFEQFCLQYAAMPYCIHEAAILLEYGFDKWVDEVVVVSAPEPIRIARVMERDKLSEELVRHRLQFQYTEEQRLARAHEVILNDGQTMLLPQVIQLHQNLISVEK